LPGAGRVRDPLVAVALEEILALVVEDLDTLHRRVHLERLADLALHHVPRVLTHAARGVDDEIDVFAIDWNAADLVFVYRRAVIRKEALHLLAELLLRLSKTARKLGSDLGVVLPVQHLRADTGELALQLRDLDLLEIDCIDDGRELASHPLRLAENVLELLLIADHQPVELRLRLLETDRLEDLRDHEQQNDRAEAARDGIEKRQVQCLDIASLTLFHGQSSAGASIEPPVLSARSQYAGAASGSPSIASSI